MIYTDILCIATIAVFIIDCSGVIDAIKGAIAPLLTKYLGIKITPDRLRIKPFDCSLCSTFWAGVIYLLVVGAFTIPNLLYVCMCAYCTIIIKSAIELADEAISTILYMANKLLNKIQSL